MTAPRQPALEARDLWFAYSGGRSGLHSVSLAAEAGEITMILGASGSGKTTLLKLCKGLLEPQRGVVRVLGRPVVADRRHRLDPAVAYIPQHLGLVRNLPVLDNVLTGALARVAELPSLLRRLPATEQRRAHALLERLGIGHKADEKVHALSGGERQRVAIARALMQEPRLLLADEFVSQLDVHTSRDILGIVRGIADDGVAVVVATHELDLVDRYADGVIVLRDGEKVLDRRARTGTIEDFALALRG
jgi:phosphonate transport system ATP-binding protein